jgi:hypothetical protein
MTQRAAPPNLVTGAASRGASPRRTAMNAVITPASRRNVPAPARRRLIGRHAPARDALDRFNLVLARLGHAPMALDELATRARGFARPDVPGQTPAWIVERMRRGLTIGLMAADPSWQAEGRSARAARIVTGYLHDAGDLVPDDLPRYGRFDDALVVDAAWSVLSGEVAGYLDFCRLRRIEADLRGCPETAFVFGRREWQEARRAEQGLIAHRRRAGLSSYVPATGTCGFRVC